MRDANINIRMSDLQKVIKQLGMAGSITAQQFAEACMPYTCTSRLDVKTNAKNIKKIKKVMKVSKTNTELFRSLLLSARTDEKHKLDYVKHINEGTNDYMNLAGSAVLAVEYAQSYDMVKTDGMQEFITVGVKLMRRKFGLNRFKTLAGKIFEAKRVAILMQGEGLKKGALVATEYFKKLEKETHSKYEADIPNDVFVNFIYASEEIDKAKAKISDWIEAQFAGLSFMDILPEINQIHGDGAIQRYLNHKYAKPVKKDGKTDMEIDISLMDPETLKYFKNL